MKNKALLYFMVFFFSFLAFSQEKNKKLNIDSLYQIEMLKPNSKAKVDQLIKLYKKSIKQHNIRKDIVDEALQIAEKIFYIEGIGICYSRKGITARYEQNYSQSIIFHKRALAYLEKATDSFQLSKCYNSLGVTYRKLNLEKEAFKNYLKALKLAELRKDFKGQSIALNGIGNVFLNVEQYEEALHYFKKELKIEIAQNNIRGQEYSLGNIGEIFIEKKQYDSAYYYINKSYQLSVKSPRRINIAVKQTMLGRLYLQQKKYKKSIEEYQKSIPKFKEFKNKRYLSKVYINIGINQLHLKQFNKSYANINKGIELGKEVNSKENTSLGYEALVNYYTQTNNYDKALEAQETAKIYHDSIVNIASQRSMLNTQIAYKTKEKDDKIHKLALDKHQNEETAKSNFNRFIITAVLGLVSIALLSLLYLMFRKKTDLELQLKNDEIQNYILKIGELNDLNKEETGEDISNRFKEFDLSKREIEVLKHIANGLKNEDISEKMFVSKNTIKSHITNIYAKLDVKNRIQAIKKIQN